MLSTNMLTGSIIITAIPKLSHRNVIILLKESKHV